MACSAGGRKERMEVKFMVVGRGAYDAMGWKGNVPIVATGSPMLRVLWLDGVSMSNIEIKEGGLIRHQSGTQNLSRC